MMGPELGLELRNAVQNAQLGNCPVMLVLAGTPDLPRHLNTMGASFWERCTALPTGRLGPDDSADAVRIPLEDGGRAIEADALETVVRDSQGYPYFLQLLGELIWDGSPVASSPISLDDVNRVRPRFRMVQRRFYGNRFRKLKRAMLVPVAAAVASLFVGRERRAQSEVEHAVCGALAELGRAADEAASIEACERLCDFGYVWPVHDGTEEEFEPGIPSLMDYVLIQVKRRAG